MKAIIFDFDGTLANTLPICFYAFQSVFQQFDGRELTAQDIVQMFGPSETGIIQANLQHPNKEAAIELYYEKYAESHAQFVQPNDEITALLQDLEKSGMKLGIFTGKARRSLDISLQALQMDGLFDVMITGDDVFEPKPAPEGLFKALALLAVDSTEAIFVGDSEADIVAGLQANVTTVGVHWLPDYQTQAFTAEPHHIVKDVIQFKKLIGDLA